MTELDFTQCCYHNQPMNANTIPKLFPSVMKRECFAVESLLPSNDLKWHSNILRHNYSMNMQMIVSDKVALYQHCW